MNSFFFGHLMLLCTPCSEETASMIRIPKRSSTRNKNLATLEKEVLEALFTVPERSDEAEKRTHVVRVVKRSRHFGELVTKPLDSDAHLTTVHQFSKFQTVKTFCSRMHFSLGAGCSAAARPVGRVLEADLRARDSGSGMCYSYSCSKGAFVGVSLEGNMVATRMDSNLRFYGDPYLTTPDILLGIVDRPKAAEPLYAALNNLYSRLRF